MPKTSKRRPRRPTLAGGSKGSRARGSLAETQRPVTQLIPALRAGFPFARLTGFQCSSGIPIDRIARVVQLPPRTLARRKAAGRLTQNESDRLVRLARLYDRAVELFDGQRERATEWLLRPQWSLGGMLPIEAAESEAGAREVEAIIGRIEHGIVA